MDRDEAKARGAALRVYLAARLPVAGVRSVTALARMAGIQPTTATSWWTKGYVPDSASLRLLADALGVDVSELMAAYEGSAGRTRVFSDPELEALLERAAETAVRRVLAEQVSPVGIEDPGYRSAPPSATSAAPETVDPPGPPTRGPRRVDGQRRGAFPKRLV